MDDTGHINSDNTRPQRQRAEISEISRMGFTRHIYTLPERSNLAGQQNQSAQGNDGNLPRLPETDHQTAVEPQGQVDGNSTIARVRRSLTSLRENRMGDTLRYIRNVFRRRQHDNTINFNDWMGPSSFTHQQGLQQIREGQMGQTLRYIRNAFRRGQHDNTINFNDLSQMRYNQRQYNQFAPEQLYQVAVQVLHEMQQQHFLEEDLLFQQRHQQIFSHILGRTGQSDYFDRLILNEQNERQRRLDQRKALSEQPLDTAEKLDTFLKLASESNYADPTEKEQYLLNVTYEA